MKRHLFFPYFVCTNLLLLFSSSLIGQIIPENRLVDWSSAGLQEEFSADFIPVDFDGNNDGITNNDEYWNEFLLTVADASIVQFPEGQFLFHSPMMLPENIIIKGMGSENTEFLFNLDQPSHAIQIRGLNTLDTLFFTASPAKSDTVLNVANGNSFSIGDYIHLLPEDENIISSSWAYHSSGQLCRITSISDSSITIDEPIKRNYDPEELRIGVRYIPKENVGIEALKITRLDETESQNSNILFERATNCFVHCIESYNCNFSHIEISKSSHIEVQGSYFQNGFTYGSGGKAYGTMLHFTTSQCAIENNIFNHLRHSMIVQAGANSNVFGYNYSINPFWTDVILPEDSAGDMVLHGNFAYANIFEGNIGQNIIIDNSHGINGKLNTFFRNRAELYGIFMNASPSSDGQNYIGNEITKDEILFGNYWLTGTDHYEYGNNQLATTIPEGTEDLSLLSLYLTEIPSFYAAETIWPSIGYPNELNENDIPSKTRYENNILTYCNVSNLIDTTVISSVEMPQEISIYPNPATTNIHLRGTFENYSAVLINVVGTKFSFHSIDQFINIHNLPRGIYIFQLSNMQREMITTQKIQLR